MKLKYIALKLKGFKYWIWFQTKDLHYENYEWESMGDGWGKDGARTTIYRISDNLIEGRIYSDELQY